MKRILKIGNYSHSLTEWSKISGIKRGTIVSRLSYGWTPVEAVFKPIPKITYTVYDRSTDEILAVEKTASEISEMFGISRESVIAYTANVSKGKYKLIKEDEVTGKEVYRELYRESLEEGRIK